MKNFELATEGEAVKRQFCSLCQTVRVASYVWKFRDLEFGLTCITKEEAYSTFVAGLTPHIVEEV